MTSLSVDEKDWLQEQIRTAYVYSHTNSSMDRVWGQLKNAWKEYKKAKLDCDSSKMKDYATQIISMQTELNIRPSSQRYYILIS